MRIRTHDVMTGPELLAWRVARGWSLYRAAIWWGGTPDAWRGWERRGLLPLPLRQRIAELQWQERITGLIMTPEDGFWRARSHNPGAVTPAWNPEDDAED